MNDDMAIGLTTGPLTADPDTVARGIDAMPSSVSDVFASSLGNVFDQGAGPTAMIGRALGRSFAESGVDPTTGQPVMAPEPDIPADEANAIYSIPGELKFDNPVPDSVADSMYETKRDELARQDILRRRPAGFGATLGTMGAEFGSSALDPLNVAASFVPVVGEARYADWLANAGSAVARAGIRAGVGAAQGVAGTAPIAALQYGLSKQEQGDMTAADALLNIAYGGILGGGLHAVGGAIGDALHGAPTPDTPEALAIAGAPLATRETALRTAIAQVAEGRPVEVMPVLDENTLRLLSRESALRTQASQLDDFLNNLDVSPDAAPAADTLARLQAVESQLADESIAPEARRALLTRRDELLTDTTPEDLQETAAPLEIQRQAQAQRANISDMLSQLEQQRTALAADTALSPLPKLQDDPRLAQAMRYAAGEPLPEDAAATSMADAAVKQPPSFTAPSDGDVAALRASLADTQRFMSPAELSELGAIDAEHDRAQASANGFDQAAACIGRGGL